MADDLKRVGLKLTAEGAVDFKESLKGCTSAAKDSRAELKLLQSQYDENTTAAQKMADKQKYLSEMVDIYGDKVAILNRQLDEMKNAENRDEEAITKKERELKQAQTTLNNYKKNLEDCNKAISTHKAELEEWGKKFQEVGGKIEKVGEVMTKTVTAAVVGTAAASVKAWEEVDEAMDTVIKMTGATGDAAEELQGVVENIATTIPTDFNTAAEAVGAVNTRFGLMGDELEELSSLFVQFASINDTDVNGAVMNVSKALTAYGQSSKDCAGFLDSLNKIAQATGISVDTLTSGVTSNAAVFQEMGLNASGAAEAIGMIEMSGADTSTVLGGLSKALKAATKEGKDLPTALYEVQDAILNGTDSMDGLTYAYELFGKSGANVFQAVQNGTLDFKALDEAATESGMGVADTFNAMLDPMDETKTILNELKTLGYEIINAAGPMIIEVLKGVKDVVSDLHDKWSSLSPEAQETIIKAALIAAAVGPVLVVVGKLIVGIGQLITFGPVLIGAISGVIGIAAPLVAALVGIGLAVKAVYDHWDELKEMVSLAAQQMKANFNTIKYECIAAFTKIKEGITEKINAARDAVKKAIDKIKSFFNFTWSLPKIKLPHFVQTGTTILGLPTIGVEWYKKAYERAAYYDSPTVRPDGRGFGDGSGGEFAVGERKLAEVIRENTDERVIVQQMTVNIYEQPGEDTNALVRQFEAMLTSKVLRERAAIG